MKFSKIIGSIRFKIAAAFSLVFIIIAFVTNLLIFQYLEYNLLETQRQVLFREAEDLVANVSLDPVQIPITDEDQLIYVWYESVNVSYPLYEKAGFPQETIPHFRDLLIGAESELGLKSNLSLDSIDVVLIDRPVFNAENGFIRLFLVKGNREISNQISSIRENLIWANVLAIFLSTLLAYVVSGISLKPIQKIIGKAGTIEASEKMERLPEHAVNDEIGQLSDTINEMINRIEGSIKSQNQFFAMAAHELRTPLANMQSELEYKMSSKEQVISPDTLSSLREEVIRLKNIVQDFLLMSQLKSDTLTLRKSNFRLDDLIYDTLEKMRPVMARNKFEIKLFLEVSDEKLEIEADREKLEAVLVNLFDNARKYGDNSLPVEVKISEADRGIEISVSNQIPEQVDQLQKGMGLGLQIAEQIMQKHLFGFTLKKSKIKFTIRLIFPQSA